MTIELLLKNALTMMSMCHVLGADSEKFGAAMKNIDLAVKAIDKAKEEAQHADHDKQE